MIKKIKNYLVLSGSSLLLAVALLVPGTIGLASAVSPGCGTSTANSIANGANAAANTNDSTIGAIDCSSATGGTGGIEALAANIVNIFSIVVGIVAVIMIVYGGFRYITSGGDSGSVGNAKNTLIYAIVGLIIVALAQVIVHFVLSATTTASGTGGGI